MIDGRYDVSSFFSGLKKVCFSILHQKQESNERNEQGNKACLEFDSGPSDEAC
jgi:hypothetical protein